MKVSQAHLALLRSVPMLRGCSDRELARVGQMVDEVVVPEGQSLMVEGAHAKEAFVIVEGWAAVTVHGEPVAALGPGQFVGEVAMLDRGPRTATVVAKTPMRLLVIGPAAFAEFARAPGVSTGLALTLARRLRDADSRAFAAGGDGAEANGVGP
jgi:CRP-like cAMP-binding protein